MATVQKWGNSLALRIPKTIATKYELTVRKSGEIILKEFIPSLAKLTQGINKKNQHHLAEWLDWKPTEKEVW